ncbi:MAG: hypothetical protein ACE5JZ_03005 [Kiloniellales bacterium]
MRRFSKLLIAVFLLLSLSGCSVFGGLLGSLFDPGTTVEDVQQSRTAREVHLAVAGMFEAIVKELDAMLQDGTLSVAQGETLEPYINTGRVAIKAAGAFLLQAGQERELGRTGVAANLEAKAFAQLRTANANLDLLRATHLQAVKTAPVVPEPSAPPPLLATPLPAK